MQKSYFYALANVYQALQATQLLATNFPALLGNKQWVQKECSA